MKKKLKKILSFILAATMCISLAACAESEQGASSEQSKAEASSETSVAPTEEPSSKEESQAATEITLTDREGNEITVPVEIESIVSIGPSVTEILIDLGLSDKIVGIDTYSAMVEGASELEVPQFDMMAPDNETLAELEADLIISTGMSAAYEEDPYKTVKDLGTVVTYVPTAVDIQAIKDDVLFIGELTGTSDKAQELVDEMTVALTDFANIDTNGYTVYVEISNPPYMMGVGGNTYIDELISLTGSVNVLSDQDPWASVNEEFIVSKNPAIILTSVNYVEDAVGEINARSGWDAIDAVKNEQVYLVNPDSINVPNHNVVLFLEEYKAIIDGITAE